MWRSFERVLNLQKARLSLTAVKFHALLLLSSRFAFSL